MKAPVPDLAETRRVRPSAGEIFAALEPFTGPLDAATRVDLEHEVTWLTELRGSELIREGEAGDSLYFVMSGRLEVLVQREGGGFKQSIAEIGPGESVGEAALLTNEPRGATVQVLEDSELLRLSRAGFERLVAGHPRAMTLFARTLASRLQRSLREREPVRHLRAETLASVADCHEIAKTENLVLRNLKITQMYHRLSLDLARLVGQRDANWCTFAASASKTAGYSIRGEDLPLFDLWRAALDTPSLGPTLRRVFVGLGKGVSKGLRARFDAVLAGVSAAISEGNLKVFNELGPLFASFVHTFHDAVEYDRDALARFLDAHLRHGPTEAGGQSILREAFGHYHDAIFERSEKARAELMLLANVKIGLHEQVRLQPEITRGLNVPLDVGLAGLLPFPGGAALERRLAEALRLPFRTALTRLLMRLRLPRGDLRLGQDVPGAQRNQMFPDVLRAIRHPELITVLEQLANDTTTTVGSSATDWASLDQRMSFIADLFRTHQRRLDLFESPFEYEQRLEMASDRVPHGPL